MCRIFQLLCVLALAPSCLVLCPATHACDCLAPGLIGEYFSFDSDVVDFPAVPASREPTLKRVDLQINFPAVEGEFYGTGMKDSFYVRWSGLIEAPVSGQYTLSTESDDGSRVFVDGKQIVDNHGLHGMEEEEGEIHLNAGVHRIKIEFIQDKGAKGCILRWKLPGGAPAVVPVDALMHWKREEQRTVTTAVATDPPPPLIGYAEIPPEPAENATLDEKIQSVLPTPEENQFLNIPWRRNLQEARLESQRQGKPLYLWVMNGAPSGFT